jgi:hypothetical protein
MLCSKDGSNGKESGLKLLVGDVIERPRDLELLGHERGYGAHVSPRIVVTHARDGVDAEAVEVVGQAAHEVALQPVARAHGLPARVA